MSDQACPRCSFANAYSANFCASCGAPIGKSEEHTESHDFDLGAEAESVGMLLAVQGPTVGAKYNLESGTTTLGRHPESDIFLDDITVSRRHVEISHTDGAFRVRDVGSLNGTYLNRSRIDEAELQSGDELQVGRFKLQFVVRT
ncbi:MAG: FHA domain-containing protein [Acidimicrobiales bacterium]